MTGGVGKEKLAALYAENADAKGVFAVSPSYHGICSDMKSLIDITHDRGGIFIADEAHGNHVYFHEKLTAGALSLGADYACQSLHKMSGSLTQSSLLHGKGERVDRSRLRANLQMTQNTSPSYLLQVSLDLARSRMATRGRDILENLIVMSEAARKELAALPGIEVLGDDLIGEAEIFAYDPIRLVVSARKLGIEGYELFRVLREEYNIEMEFGDYFYGICIMGIGTVRRDVDRLIFAMKYISEKYKGQRKPLQWDEEIPPMPPRVMTPREAHFSERIRVPWSAARGRISAQMIFPYPPGIPTICPGEIITEDVWRFLDEQNLNERHLHGTENGKLDSVAVVRE